ncbi:hypothetical protein D9M68_875260 [compost metagenome]
MSNPRHPAARPAPSPSSRRKHPRRARASRRSLRLPGLPLVRLWSVCRRRLSIRSAARVWPSNGSAWGQHSSRSSRISSVWSRVRSRRTFATYSLPIRPCCAIRGCARMSMRAWRRGLAPKRPGSLKPKPRRSSRKRCTMPCWPSVPPICATSVAACWPICAGSRRCASRTSHTSW